jgi:hypothetical protein
LLLGGGQRGRRAGTRGNQHSTGEHCEEGQRGPSGKTDLLRGSLPLRRRLATSAFGVVHDGFSLAWLAVEGKEGWSNSGLFTKNLGKIP